MNDKAKIIALIAAAVAALAAMFFITNPQIGSFRATTTEPRTGAANIRIEGFVFTAAFNRTLSSDTSDVFTITPEVEGTVTAAGKTLTFTARNLLIPGTTYTVTLKGRDARGRRGTAQTVSFTTEAIAAEAWPEALKNQLFRDEDYLQDESCLGDSCPAR